jgi:aquaporin Z
MATKKSAASVRKKTGASKAVKTQVTTVKAVEAGSARPAGALLDKRGGLLRTPVVAAAIAEFIGAFLLAVTVLIVRNEPFYLFIGLIGIFMMIGGLSGAHLNPAVTIGAWVSRRINRVRAISYIVAQFLGAMLAVVALNAFISQAPEVSADMAQLGQAAPKLFAAAALPEGKELIVFMAEAVGTIILGFAYASVLRPRVKDKVAGAFTIGGGAFLAMAFASTAAAYISASVALNPAMAVSLDAIDFANIWTLGVYFVAPILGAVIGFFLHDLLKNAEVEK